MRRLLFAAVFSLSTMMFFSASRHAFASNPGAREACDNSACPDAVPTPIGPFRLEVCSGGPVYATPWGEHIGCGPYRRLNWLGKAHLAAGGEFLRVYRPDTGEIFAFTRSDGTDTYLPFESRGWPDGVKARVERNGDGRPNRVFVTLPDGSFWRYEFGDIASFGSGNVVDGKTNLEGVPTNTDAAGYVFSLTRFQTANGLGVSLSYHRNAASAEAGGNYILLTDPSGRRHYCYYDGTGNITRISIESEGQVRSWDYSYADAGRTMTERNRQTGYTIVMTTDGYGNPTFDQRSGPGNVSTTTSATYTQISGGGLARKWMPSRRVTDNVTTSFSPSALYLKMICESGERRV